MDLTIAIPTYNRNDTLRANVERLLPQLTPECRLLIVDNGSAVPVAETLAPCLARYPDARVEIVRNRVNIGSAANFARCFERCESEWVWLLSDDDAPRPDAIATIRRHLEAHPDCLYFNFASDFVKRPAPIVTRGLEDFAERMDHFGNILFMSVCVYKVAAIQPQLRYMYHYGYTLGAHVAILLPSIGEAGTCCLSDAELVTWNRVCEWPQFAAGLGMMTLLELPMSDRAFVALRRKIGEGLDFMHLKYFGRQCLEMAMRDGDRHRAAHLLEQVYRRFFRPGGRAPWATYWLYKTLVRFPAVGAGLLGAYRRARGSRLAKATLEDRFSRL